MKVAVHIPFYYVSSRLTYLHKVLDNFSIFPHDVDIYIYSDKLFDLEFSHNNFNCNIIKIDFIKTRFSRSRMLPWSIRRYVNPCFITWENRKYVHKFIDDYDVQMYIEDDIGFNIKTFDYWLNYKELCLKNDYNIGFLRYEQGCDGKMFSSDLLKTPDKLVILDGNLFTLNDVEPYCAFWIYDKSELSKFIHSEEYRFKFKDRRYYIMEMSAIGWNSITMKRYKGTVIPLVKCSLDNTYMAHEDCYVNHLPNNYYASRVTPLPLRYKFN